MTEQRAYEQPARLRIETEQEEDDGCREEDQVRRLGQDGQTGHETGRDRPFGASGLVGAHDQSARGLEQDACDRGRPADRHAAEADGRETERADERPGEHDCMSAFVETDSFPARGNHCVCAFAGR